MSSENSTELSDLWMKSWTMENSTESEWTMNSNIATSIHSGWNTNLDIGNSNDPEWTTNSAIGNSNDPGGTLNLNIENSIDSRWTVNSVIGNSSYTSGWATQNDTDGTWINSTFTASLTQNSYSHEILFRKPILIAGYTELLVFIIGTPINILVLYLTILLLRKNSRSSSSYHQSNLWFVVSMTTADTLFCFIHAPMMFLHFVFQYDYNAGGCLFKYIVTYTTSISSSLSLLCLNIDKFLYLHHPLHYHRRVTTGRALTAVLITWIISLCWALFYMLGPFSKYTPPCNFRPFQLHLYMVFTVCFFIFPTLVSLLVSFYIAGVVSRVSKENAIRKNSSRSNSIAPGGGSIQKVNNARAIAFVFTTTLWSSLTFLPYRFAYLIYISPVFGRGASWSMTAAFYCLFALMATNAAGNPFITIITQRRYTTAAVRLWHWMKTTSRRQRERRKSSISTMVTLNTIVPKLSLSKAVRIGIKAINEDAEAQVALKTMEQEDDV